jgi:hypothetical protein
MDRGLRFKRGDRPDVPDLILDWSARLGLAPRLQNSSNRK